MMRYSDRRAKKKAEGHGLGGTTRDATAGRETWGAEKTLKGQRTYLGLRDRLSAVSEMDQI